MRRLLYILIMCSIFAACDKLPANGDLDGMWQVMEIEHNGKVKNMQMERVYMSIQLKLFELTDVQEVAASRFYGYFEHKGDSLKLWQFSRYSHNETAADDNIPFTEKELPILNKWGFYSLKESFKVEKLTKDLLIIKSDSARIKYIKF